jgi:hypothetical protein
MEALLVRVGIDSTFGQWNAPVDPVTREFVYVPIPEDRYENHPAHQKPYSAMEPVLHAFRDRHCRDMRRKPLLPPALRTRRMHLDPDFEHLTYGDKPPRMNRMRELKKGDLLVFYAGLRSIHPADTELVYALIGLYVVQESLPPTEVAESRRHENAHTRRAELDASHLVIRAQPGRSGRFDKCIPIGKLIDGYYYVREDICNEWGGISAKNGYIHRSGVPPRFKDPERFYDWFSRQQVRLLQRNNPMPAASTSALTAPR